MRDFRGGKKFCNPEEVYSIMSYCYRFLVSYENIVGIEFYSSMFHFLFLPLVDIFDYGDMT